MACDWRTGLQAIKVFMSHFYSCLSHFNVTLYCFLKCDKGKTKEAGELGPASFARSVSRDDDIIPPNRSAEQVSFPFSKPSSAWEEDRFRMEAFYGLGARRLR